MGMKRQGMRNRVLIRRGGRLWQLIVVIGALVQAGVCFADRCPDGLVSLGDAKYEVITKCGEPTFEDFRQIEKVGRTGPNETTRWTVDIEELTYDFGPNRFIRIFVFENGTLTKISKGGYGQSTEADGQEYLRKHRLVQQGDSKYEVMMKLGYPIHKEKREIERARRTAKGESVIHHLFLEEWTFDAEPGRFRRVVVFENGRVTRVDNGSRRRP